MSSALVAVVEESIPIKYRIVLPSRFDAGLYQGGSIQ
jgi:hypothetical protein